MTIDELLKKVDVIISEGLKVELRKQGHYNTGALDRSIEGTIKGNSLEGYANYYATILHHGFGPEKASMKQFPFLVSYFLSKGRDEATAKQLSAMTINAWKREGMPTSGSYAYSETGKRTQFISIVKTIVNGKVNATMSDGLDKIVNKKFNETKSETI
ncbi:MAG: hypothetical protein E6Q36_10095 [Chryseobacterium sp.]|nr:MAG: hypothetical protein E6Q36_10095 [Chryseobacterium sp.]